MNRCSSVLFSSILCITFFYLIRPLSIGPLPGVAGKPPFMPVNNQNFVYFTRASKTAQSIKDYPRACFGRFLPFLTTGALFDALPAPKTWSSEATLFAAWHTAWLAILMLTICLQFGVHPLGCLLINTGIFCGLAYNLTPSLNYTGQYWFPWDLPAMAFFTWAILMHRAKRWLMFALVLSVGCFVKETILLTTLLFVRCPRFSVSSIPNLVRCPRFSVSSIPHSAFSILKSAFPLLLALAWYTLGKRLALHAMGLQPESLTMDNSGHGLFDLSRLHLNLSYLFRPTLNSIAFVNLGTIWLLLFRRGYRLLTLAFVTGVMLWGNAPEFRVFAELLPLGIISLIDPRGTNALLK